MAFAIRIVKLCKYLKNKKHEFDISRQLLHCGTSIGANVAEAECAISRKDFASKMYIAYKECSETRFWIDLLYHSGYLTEPQYISIKRDADELFRLTSSITKSTMEHLKKEATH